MEISTKPTTAQRPFWNETPEAVTSELTCGRDGLSSDEAARRCEIYGQNGDAGSATESFWRAILRRLLEPLSLILLGAGIVSIATGDSVGGSIIVAILVLSVGLDTVQEGHAIKAAEVLRHSVALKAEVKRDGAFHQIDVVEVVPHQGRRSAFLDRTNVGHVRPAFALARNLTDHGRAIARRMKRR